ncbi:MAG TPA: flavodoxin domain-containing protein [Jiangellales bacterium]|nr:flavodoxin domain-containing protein [Jiangellales bacterium]
MARVLLLYGTREGHTADVAREIAATLSADGHEVDPVHLEHGPGPTPADFDGVVVGSSVHMGRHERAVIDWVRHVRGPLSERPAAFFTVCLSAVAEHGEEQLARSYVDGFVEETGWHPDIVGLFGGALLYTQYGFAKRAVIKDIAARQGLPTDTSRDWDLTDHEAVRHFAADTSRLLAPRSGGDDAPAPQLGT